MYGYGKKKKKPAPKKKNKWSLVLLVPILRSVRQQVNVCVVQCVKLKRKH